MAVRTCDARLLAFAECVKDFASGAHRVARRDLVRHGLAIRADASRCRTSVASPRCHFHPMSMLRYYMTPETRQAVIAESNRLIATRAAMNGSRSRGGPHDRDSEPSSVESVFARLVADLQAAAAAGCADGDSVPTAASS
jgi:hypothetical protein